MNIIDHVEQEHHHVEQEHHHVEHEHHHVEHEHHHVDMPDNPSLHQHTYNRVHYDQKQKNM